ncbi:hypothetical protein M5K25_004501 [Dendrobium thyrsiflorum]|uniref:Erythronate-4-phosphate dehydrogenase family protein n=1 Tax=Dendrobium thyrsiflorum TaxID=117978 RepID=A0ABD0VM64_DENTH
MRGAMTKTPNLVEIINCLFDITPTEQVLLPLESFQLFDLCGKKISSMYSPSSRGSSYDPTKLSSFSTPERKMFKHPLYIPWSSPCLNLKVFYVRLCNCEIHKSAPEHLSLNYIPLSPETIVEVNGTRSAFVSSTLRRDRIDKKSEEAIFVSTDNIRMTGSLRFEVYGSENLLLSGVLELSIIKKWSIKCQPIMSGGFYFMKRKQFISSEASWPTIEVYVTGLFSGSAIILTKTLYLGKKKKKKNQMVLALDSVPEDEEIGIVKKVLPKGPQQMMKYEGFGSENEVDIKSDCVEVNDGELSLFNAGVGVGVGIGLTICLCIGIGTGLLFRTYKTTARNYKGLL